MQLLGLPKMTDKSTLSTLVLTSCYLQCYSLAMKMLAKFKNTKTICILSLQTPIDPKTYQWLHHYATRNH